MARFVGISTALFRRVFSYTLRAKTDRAELANRPARTRRRPRRHPIGQAGALDPRPAQRLDAVTKRGAGFRSLNDTRTDITSPHRRLMLTVLGGLAEFEREPICARTSEGRKLAKERGVRFGRPRKLTPHQREHALRRLAAGETQADVAKTYNVDPTTIGRLQ
jgi:hypothetical protein